MIEATQLGHYLHVRDDDKKFLAVNVDLDAVIVLILLIGWLSM